MSGRSSSKVFVDSSSLILLVEGTADLRLAHETAARRLGVEEVILCSSLIVLSEVLVAPMKAANHEWAEKYRTLFADGQGFVVIPITAEVAEAAARIRSTSALKLPDALHIAAGTAGGCEVFLTEDKEWGRLGCKTVSLSDLAS